MNNNELTHFGVLGMRWGVRRGKNEGVSNNTSQKKALSEEEIKQRRTIFAKKVLIVGSAVVATGLAVYGTYKVSKFVKGHSKEIEAAKELVGFMNARGKSAKGVVSQVSPKPKTKKYTDAEWTKKKAEILREIRGKTPINPELRAKIKKDLFENNPIYRDLIRQQVEHEKVYGPPTPAEMQEAKEWLIKRQRVEWP